MNRAERIYRLHALLRNRRLMSLQRMMDTLEASRATVVRDLGYMRDFMGAPIIYERSRNGYYYDPKAPEFELPGLWFNASELYALLAADQLLEAVQPGLLTPYIGPLKTRIRKLLQQSGHSSDTVTSRIRLQPMAVRMLVNLSKDARFLRKMRIDEPVLFAEVLECMKGFEKHVEGVHEFAKTIVARLTITDCWAQAGGGINDARAFGRRWNGLLHPRKALLSTGNLETPSHHH